MTAKSEAPAAQGSFDDLLNEVDAEAKGEPIESAGGFDSLLSDLDKGSGKPWIPENPGDTLFGIVSGVDTITSDYRNAKSGEFEELPLIDITDPEGELWSVRGYGAALSNQLKKADPRVGDKIAIRFVGMVTPKTAGYQPYKGFVVRTSRA